MFRDIKFRAAHRGRFTFAVTWNHSPARRLPPPSPIFLIAGRETSARVAKARTATGSPHCYRTFVRQLMQRGSRVIGPLLGIADFRSRRDCTPPRDYYALPIGTLPTQKERVVPFETERRRVGANLSALRKCPAIF